MGMKHDKTAIAHAIGKAPILWHLPLSARKKLSTAARVIHCHQRMVVQATGTPHKYMFLVVSGQLDYCGAASDGDEITLATFGPGCASSWLALYHRTPARRDLIGNPDTVLLAIPCKVMRSTLEQYPMLYPDILEYEANRFRSFLDWQQLSLVTDRSRRIALMLIQLAEIKGDSSPQPVVRLTGERLAKTTQCSRQTLMTCLRKLQDAGLVEQAYGEVRLLDIEGLRAYANRN
jgi:CRP/FNR family transcriptional regulator, cyclic AMP receptor protein